MVTRDRAADCAGTFPATGKGLATSRGMVMRKLFGVLLLVSGVALGGPAVAQGDDDQVALRTLLDELLLAVAQGDDALLDETVCMDWQASARMHKLDAHGLLPEDAGEADAVAAAYREDYRMALTEFVSWQQRMGGSVASVNMQRIRASEGDAQEGLPLLGETHQFPITASGILAVEWNDRNHVSDVAVMKVGDYWCLNPVTVP